LQNTNFLTPRSHKPVLKLQGVSIGLKNRGLSTGHVT